MSRNGDLVDPKAWADLPLLSGSVDPAGGKVNLSWTAPPTAYGGFSGYQIFRSDNGGAFSLLNSVSAATYTYQDTALTTGHTYTYYVAPTWINGFQLTTNRVTVAGTLQSAFAAPGVSTWTKPQGLVSATIVVIGGGGGGPAGNGGPVITGRSSGGAGGAYASANYLAAALSATETVTVGAGGLGGTSVFARTGGYFGTTGNGGGTSSFGSHISCAGGGGGQADTSSGANTCIGGSASVVGGSSVVTESGGNSFKESGTFPANTTLSGAGGGEVNTHPVGGIAANSGLGFFGGNGGLGGTSVMNGNATPGSPGVNYGGGGGCGGFAGTSGPNDVYVTGAGGKGGDGVVVVTSFFW